MLTPTAGHSVWFAGLFGAGIGLGLALILRGLHPRPDAATPGAPWRALVDRRLVLGFGAAVAAGLVTRWPTGAVLAGLAVWGLPRVVGRDAENATVVARIEAIAGWTEMLRDTLSAAAGLEQSIHATAATAPAPIRDQVSDLVARLDAGDRLGPALRRFADELADPTADLVVAALVLAVEHQARNLTELLSSLAAAAREQAGLRLRIAAGRSRTRTSVRVIVGTTVGLAAGLVVLNRHYLAPYDTLGGQVVLLMVGGLFTTAFVWLARIARVDTPARLLAGAEP